MTVWARQRWFFGCQPQVAKRGGGGGVRGWMGLNPPARCCLRSYFLAGGRNERGGVLMSGGFWGLGDCVLLSRGKAMGEKKIEDR